MVGGGIAGLYCARQLARRSCNVVVLETRDRFGGRIETGDLAPGPRGPTPFKAEFGPMRFELELQDRFKALAVDEFKIEFEDFDPPAAALPAIEYPVSSRERGPSGAPLTSLELLKLGVYRLFGYEPIIQEKMQDDGRVVGKVSLPAAGEKWLSGLSERELDKLRETAEMPDGRPLFELGFWNALYGVMSPPAVAFIFHFGTFYHLMPDNPNAAEWAIFWLRLFKLGDKPLQTIPGGVSQVTDCLLNQIAADCPTVTLRPSHKVVALKPLAGGLVEVEALRTSAPAPQNLTSFTADHVVLALPKEPLVLLSAGFPERIKSDLNSVIAFPLLKVFCVTKTPKWWKTTPRAQDGAWVVPTREVHYFPPATPESPRYDNTLVLFYTDRPAVTYWQHYVVGQEHDRAECNANPELKAELARVLMQLHLNWAESQLRTRTGTTFRLDDPVGRAVMEAVGGLHDRFASDFAEGPGSQLVADFRPALAGEAADILFGREKILQWQLNALSDYAIRDWSREPFGAGCHAWAPGARSWEIRERLASFGFEGREDVECLHVCGEAYSDYQGFIEGALRSAETAVDTIRC